MKHIKLLTIFLALMLCVGTLASCSAPNYAENIIKGSISHISEKFPSIIKKEFKDI